MAHFDNRQDKPYRRGLILGLTMAEVMVLLIFVLLMALGAALGNREKRLKDLESGAGNRLVEAVRAAYPQAKSADDYYKELVRAINVRKEVEGMGSPNANKRLLEDAELGKRVREKAGKTGSVDPYQFAEKALMAAGAVKKSQWPPFFSLSEAGGYYFDSGKATLRPDFELKLRDAIIPKLRSEIDIHGIDVVEVIGHTDEVPMVGTSNLDESVGSSASAIIEAAANRFPIEKLTSTDNAGLAIARAVAVVRILRADPRLRGVTILPLSGAQLIVPIDKVADGKANRKPDQFRRRVEIRLRRSTEQVAEGDQR